MPDVPLAALVLHQRSAPIDARERMLDCVAPWRSLTDRAVLATCHRVEVYLAAGAAESARDLRVNLDPHGALGLTLLRGSDAIAHLFEVATGLDSAMQGEPQIRSQVRRALAEAPVAIDPLLRRLFERALRLARSAYGGEGAAPGKSVGAAAVDEVVRLLDAPRRATVLVIGAGEMGSLAARALARRVGRLVVANRDEGRGRALARSVGAEAIGLDEVPARVVGADAVISAADTRGSVLTVAVLGPRVARSPLALVDIAVPRSVGPAARKLAGLVYRSVDDLDAARSLSPDEVARIRERCATEARRFARETAGRSAAAAIQKMRARAEAMRARQLDRALRHLGHLSARDRRVVETLSTRVVNTLLHDPTVALRSRPERSAEALALFGITGDTR